MSEISYTPEELEAIAAEIAEEIAEEFAEQMQQKLAATTGQGVTGGMDLTYQGKEIDAELEEKLEKAEERQEQVEREIEEQEEAIEKQEEDLDKMQEQLEQQQPEATSGAMGARTAPENTAIPTLKPPKNKPEDTDNS